MQNDLKSHSSEVAKKWEFDFSMEQPILETSNSATYKKMSWEPL